MKTSASLRILSIITVLFVLASSLIFSVSAEGNAAVSVASATGKAGETVTVSVNLSENPGLIGMVLNLSYDTSKVELVNASDAGKLNGFFHSQDYSGNKYTLLWEEGDASANNTATGTIATLTFKLKEDCDKSDISISGEGYDFDLNTVGVSCSGGTITNSEAPATTSTTTPTTGSEAAPATTTKKPATTKTPTTTKKSSSNTKRVTTTRNTIINLEPEEEVTTALEESTTDFLSLFETTTEESTTESTTEESTTELEDEGSGTLSKTRIVLIVLFVCFGVVGVAIIVSMVRKTKRG